jgi:glyoxylase-like metal-dependent hydrolase (beta-lactamase superfamily II)
MTPVYEVLALRFGTHAERVAHENFLMFDASVPAETPMPTDFYLWVIRDGNNVVLVDTGFPEEMAARRSRTILRSPIGGLADLGIRAFDVSDVVITHMHYDHAGNIDQFPNARIHLQEEELKFCTGGAMRHAVVRRPFEAVNVTTAVERLYDGRLRLLRGEVEILPGVTVHPVPGHTPGTQVVRVRTQRGWVVLASDAAHLWANLRGRSPFPILESLSEMMEGYDILASLADGEDHIIPGHDPEVAQRFPSYSVPDWVCLHEPPIDTRSVAVALEGAGR